MIDTFKPTLTDEAVLQELAQRLTRFRIQHNLTQQTLARDAGVSKRTVERLEAGHSTQFLSLIRILRVLGLLTNLESLVPEPPVSPIARLRGQPKNRKRASGTKKPRSKPKNPVARAPARSTTRSTTRTGTTVSTQASTPAATGKSDSTDPDIHNTDTHNRSSWTWDDDC